ncbi:MAG: hypothetical protein IT307_14585 [Chloroflexi bacterium]|nr:hypothetical protein [Chloroflexota bacterium]
MSTPQNVVAITAKPGETVSGDISFTFDGAPSAQGAVQFFDFRMTETGPVAAPPGGPVASTASRWLTFDRTSFPMQPGVPEAIQFQVKPPVEAEPGDHVIGVLLNAAVATESQARISPSLGVRLVVTVPGAARREAILTKFQTVHDALSIGWSLNDQWVGLQTPNPLPLFDSGPVVFRAGISNNGNVQIAPGGEVVLSDLLGNTVARVPVQGPIIYPADSATVGANWSPSGLLGVPLGVYRAKFSFDYGGQDTLVGSDWLMFLPWKGLLIAALVAAGLRLLLPNQLSFRLPARKDRQARRLPALVRPGADAAPGATAPAGNGADLKAAAAARAGGIAARLGAAEQPTVVEPKASPPPAPPVASDPARAAPGSVPPTPAVPARSEPLEPRRPEPETPARRVPPLPAQLAAAARPANGAVVPPGPSWEELFKQGQEAARGGDRRRAYGLFQEAVEANPRAEDAWLWRAGTTESEKEAIACLEQVLALNPRNERARKGLEAYRARQH